MTLIYLVKNLNWLILVLINVLKRIDTVREVIQWIDILLLILGNLYLMCQYVAIHSAEYYHINHFRIAFCFAFGLHNIFHKELQGILWSNREMETNREMECNSEMSQ